MSKIKLEPHIKWRLIVIALVIGYSFIYTYMVAILLAHSPDTIYYHVSTGILIGVLGCLTIYIVYNIDRLISRIMVKTSKFVFIFNFLISFVISVLMFAIIGWSLNVILRDIWTLNFGYLKEQIAIVNYLSILILSYYTIAYFSKSTELQNKKLKAENLEMSKALNKYATRIPSLSNKKTVLISVDHVVYFKIEDGIVFAYTDDQKKHSITTPTLSELESKLNPAIFFRINRSEIIHVDKIISFEPYFKDRLAIKLSTNNTTVYTSNKRSSQFRNWLTYTTK